MKCELALSLLHKPKVLFLDEPTIGLDVNMQRVVREFILHDNQTHKATILLTSHYMADVEALARRVIIINSGEIVYDGQLSHLIARRSPRKIVKATLSGPMRPALNSLPGLLFYDGHDIWLYATASLSSLGD